MTIKKIPANACVFEAGEVIVSDVNGENAKTAPFRMIARTGDPIEHPYWGRVVHDMDGMFLDKSSVPVDYGHDPEQVIGYANKFNTDSGDLEASGALIPYKADDRASEVIYKAKLGVPYQSSISFGGTGVRVEQLTEGQRTQVNGRDFEGPGAIIRKWPLRAIAIVSQGADQWTSTTFDSGDTVAVTIEEFQMSENSVTTEAVESTATAVEVEPVQDTVEDTKPQDEQAEASDATVDEASVETDEESTELSAPKVVTPKTGTEFMSYFGPERGAYYFASGMTFAEAMSVHFQHQQAEIEALRKRLDAAKAVGDGAAEAVSFGDAVPPKKKEMAVRIVS